MFFFGCRRVGSERYGGRGFRSLCANHCQKLVAVRVRHPDIADKNVGCGRYEFAKCFGSGRSLSYRGAELLQRVGDHFSCIRFIFNQEHSNILER